MVKGDRESTSQDVHRRLRPTAQAPRMVFGPREEEVTVRIRLDGSELLGSTRSTLMRPTSVGRRCELERACRRELRTSLGRVCRSGSLGRLGAPRGRAARPRPQLDRTKGSRPQADSSVSPPAFTRAPHGAEDSRSWTSLPERLARRTARTARADREPSRGDPDRPVGSAIDARPSGLSRGRQVFGPEVDGPKRLVMCALSRMA